MVRLGRDGARRGRDTGIRPHGRPFMALGHRQFRMVPEFLPPYRLPPSRRPFSRTLNYLLPPRMAPLPPPLPDRPLPPPPPHQPLPPPHQLLPSPYQPLPPHQPLPPPHQPLPPTHQPLPPPHQPLPPPHRPLPTPHRPLPPPHQPLPTPHRPLPPPPHQPLPPPHQPLPTHPPLFPHVLRPVPRVLFPPLHPFANSRIGPQPHPWRPMVPTAPRIPGRGSRMRGVKHLVSANGRPKPKKNQKRKEKRSEGAFYCEICDRSWKTMEQLEEHNAEHEVCGRDGCNFMAHPKVVLLHVQLQHDTGLYQRVVAQNPDDVAKWIAERRKRFPTKDNVEKKVAQTKEMMDRGERIPYLNPRFKNRSKSVTWTDRKQRQDDNLKRNGPRFREQRQGQAGPANNANNNGRAKWKDHEVWRGDLPQFAGTASFPGKVDVTMDTSEEKHISDEEEWPADSKTDEINAKKPFFSNVLASIMENYGSDEDEEETEVIDSSKAVDGANSNNVDNDHPLGIEQGGNPTPADLNEDTDEGPEECAIDREDRSNIPSLNEGTKSELKSSRPKEHKPESRPRAPPRIQMKRHQLSLLKKLLKNEIRHERNVILQCVRYVVNNNFLGLRNAPVNYSAIS